MVEGGDGEEEVPNEELLEGGPLAVPDEIDIDRRLEYGAHVVAELTRLDEPSNFLEAERDLGRAGG